MKKTRKGFTLVELVIVIAVIAILAAVLIPTFGGIIEKANQNAAMQEARNVYTMYLSEAADEDEEVLTDVYVSTKHGYVLIDDGQVKEQTVGEGNNAKKVWAVKDANDVDKLGTLVTGYTNIYEVNE